MSKLFIAFYKGRGTATDLLIRRHTRSRFSHCELVHADDRPAPGERALCLSASIRDDGVRRKVVALDAAKWEVVAAPPWAAPDAWARAEREVGKPYDVLGLALSQAVRMHLHAPGRWFCSEICAYALGLARPASYAPGDLHRRVTDRTTAVRMAVGRRSTA